MSLSATASHGTLASSLPWLVCGAVGASATALLGAELLEYGPLPVILITFASVLGGTLAGTVWSVRQAPRTNPPAVAPLLVLLALVGPLVVQVVGRLWGMEQTPLEVSLMHGVQLSACVFAALGGWRPFQPLAIIASLFAALFAATVSSHPLTLPSAIGQMLCAIAWLAVSYWSSLQVPARRLPRGRRGWMLVTLVPLLGAGAVATTMAPADSAIGTLWGLFPSSGGNGTEDGAARRGVGTGEALVAGQDQIQSFGPIEDAPFRSSQDPSLYDLFNEKYDEPVQRRTKQDRAIALPPELAKEVEARLAKSERAAREFSTQRRARSASSTPLADLKSDALFYVKGRTPLHLRHDVFDIFDGVEWYADDGLGADPPLRMSLEAGQRPWLRWTMPPGLEELLGPVEAHAIKVAHLQTNRIPTPLGVCGVHLDQLDDPSFFLWDGPLLLRMDRDALPALTAIHLQSRAFDWDNVRAWKTWPIMHPRLRVLPSEPGFERIRPLAEEWTRGVPRGYAQVDAIVRHLREGYQLDPLATSDGQSGSRPVLEFLFETKRGPDYQFATAAALLLRSLDYSTRVVGGFYAAPEQYDHRRGHTPVRSADAHVWVEVHVSMGKWVTVEPSPGYVVLDRPPRWSERVWSGVVASARWLAARWLVLGITLGAAAALFAWRHELLARWAWFRWRWLPNPEPRQRVLQTMRLLDELASLHGQPRPAGRSSGRWTRQLIASEAEAAPHVPRWAILSDWASYAPPEAALPVRDWAATCDCVACAARRRLTAARNTRRSGLEQLSAGAPSSEPHSAHRLN